MKKWELNLMMMSEIHFTSLLFMDLFCFSLHPIHKIISLMMLLVTSMFMISFYSKFSWMAYIFCLLILSGLLILFMYLTSLAMPKNIIISYEFKTMNYIITILIILFILTSKFLNNQIENCLSLHFFTNMWVNFNKSFLMLMMIMYMFLILILLMEMICSIKNSFRSMK